MGQGRIRTLPFICHIAQGCNRASAVIPAFDAPGRDGCVVQCAAMCQRLAQALGVSLGQVNVKAKTAEKLGPVGQGTAIEARASAAKKARRFSPP